MVRFQKFIKRLHFATGRCSPHFHRNVRELLNRILQQRWIGRAANGETTTYTYYMGRIRLSCGCVTQGAHIEGLWLMHKKFGLLLLLLTVYVLPMLRWEVNLLLIFETAPLFLNTLYIYVYIYIYIYIYIYTALLSKKWILSTLCSTKTVSVVDTQFA
jgi:hypothetical protein